MEEVKLCNICKEPLGTGPSLDCGGDCLRCMADVGGDTGLQEYMSGYRQALHDVAVEFERLGFEGCGLLRYWYAQGKVR